MSSSKRSRGRAELVLSVLGAVLAACGGAKRPMETPKELPVGTEYHALPQRQLGLYAVFVPPGYGAPENREKTYPLVLIIHGHGSTELRHGQLADTFGREDVLYLAPRAPYAHEEVFTELREPGWTARPTVPEQLYSIGPGDDGFVDVDRLYTDWLADTVQDTRRRYRVSDQRVVVYGHSQGATFAHLFALAHPQLVKAYFAFAGYYRATTDQPTSAAAQTLRDHGIFPFLAHNRPDPVVEASETDRLVAYFSANGVPHGSFLAETGDHYLTDEGRRRATEFLREWTRGAHANDPRKLPPLEGREATTKGSESLPDGASGE